MLIAKIMTTELIFVHPDETVGEMHKLLKTLPIHHLLVMERGTLLGLVSDRDIFKHLSPYADTKLEGNKDRFTANLPASRIMAQNVTTIANGATIREAAKKMTDFGVGLLPVTNENNKVIGILSWKDVLRYLAD